ncbi:MAG: hypothetical protein IKG93_04325 [Clostridiales bacterium]|nr:hypothetical protein [Clostridiales bacterium]
MTELAGIFSSGMVLQRDKECAIWGKETQQSTVQVLFENKVYDAEVTDGKFLVKLPAHEAVTDCRIEVSGSTKIVLEDVCFGDVYYLSGQSNMELPVYRTRDISAEEIDASDYPYIRQYRVTPQFQICSENPPELPKLSWTRASGEKLAEMSAVGFFSAKRLYDAHQVPIGLVLAAQGGSTIEAWMPAGLLSEFGDFEKIYAPFVGDGVLAKYLQEQEAKNASWRKALESGDDAEYPSAIPEGATEITFPGILLEKEGRGYQGIVWCYKEFELQQEPVEDAFLYLGDLIDADQTFVNGQLVGKTEYRYPPRKYPFDGRILKKGRNLICVRLLIEWGDGGFVAEHPYYIRCGSETVELSGTWRLFYGQKSATPSLPGLRGQVIPTALFETSVRPLRDLTFKGIWWYQGESNCGDPSRYNEKFSSMVAYWRKWFGEELPIICVEMCDYSDPISGEQPEFWAAIQEQQRAAEKEVPLCAVVSARDLGAPLELHPQKKSELGARLARIAEKLFY